MLKVAANPSFWADVNISVPGEAKPQSIKVSYRHLPTDAARAFKEWAETKVPADTPEGEDVTDETLAQLPELPPGEDRKMRHRTDFEICSRLVLDWKGLDEPFSQDALRSLLQSYALAGAEIYLGWLREKTTSKAKN